jgi:hypothetical protein
VQRRNLRRLRSGIGQILFAIGAIELGGVPEPPKDDKKLDGMTDSFGWIRAC